MRWYQNSWEDFDEETKEALTKAAPIITCFGIMVLTVLILYFRYARQQERIRFNAREIPAVISRKYIDKYNHISPTIRLLYHEEELSFFGSRRYYDSLQVGDSLYKPAGSAYFYLIEHPNGVRTLRRLLNDSL